MPNFEDIPAPCYELMEVLQRNGSRVPYRDLPTKLKDIGLLRVSRYRGLIDLVLWYEPSRNRGVAISANCVGVGAPACWLPFHQMARNSVDDAIARDAKSDDRKKFLHVEITSLGTIAYEEWRLREKPRGAAHVACGQDDVSVELRLSRLKPSQKRAYLQRGEGQQGCASIEAGPPGDKAAYAWLEEHRDDGEKLPAQHTWLRYVRGARHELGENNAPAERRHGSSIARADQL